MLQSAALTSQYCFFKLLLIKCKSGLRKVQICKDKTEGTNSSQGSTNCRSGTETLLPLMALWIFTLWKAERKHDEENKRCSYKKTGVKHLKIVTFILFQSCRNISWNFAVNLYAYKEEISVNACTSSHIKHLIQGRTDLLIQLLVYFPP